MINIIPRLKAWLAVSLVLVIVSVVALAVWRLPLGIDFTGGSFMELVFEKPENVTADGIRAEIEKMGLGEAVVQEAGEGTYFIRTKALSEESHQSTLSTLTGTFGAVNELQFESIGSAIGKELGMKAIYSIIGVVCAISLYIAFAFRKVSKPVQSWKYGIVTVATLAHDVLITAGAFSIISHFTGYEVGLPFVAAMLTILGYSVHDTIVVFDRIRENLHKIGGNFDDLVNASVNQTMTRSINTSLTAVLALVAIFFFGGESLRYFVLTLIIGISTGTFSSIFLASPLLVVWNRMSKR